MRKPSRYESSASVIGGRLSLAAHDEREAEFDRGDQEEDACNLDEELGRLRHRDPPDGSAPAHELTPELPPWRRTLRRPDSPDRRRRPPTPDAPAPEPQRTAPRSWSRLYLLVRDRKKMAPSKQIARPPLNRTSSRKPRSSAISSLCSGDGEGSGSGSLGGGGSRSDDSSSRTQTGNEDGSTHDGSTYPEGAGSGKRYAP